ncbi:hypothetical protein EUGRSUZ_C02360 [Eucalyptus grandis]|uniref:Uncharacterized protein n=2 Tax=Eucalyptus grandis TaxID=71139 RepID=A0ACC3LH61_EUCGR|nr:hypothetical protein EUGRSUZ_C02360 [Eucalyptus grandis]
MVSPSTVFFLGREGGPPNNTLSVLQPTKWVVPGSTTSGSARLTSLTWVFKTLRRNKGLFEVARWTIEV